MMPVIIVAFVSLALFAIVEMASTYWATRHKRRNERISREQANLEFLVRQLSGKRSKNIRDRKSRYMLRNRVRARKDPSSIRIIELIAVLFPAGERKKFLAQVISHLHETPPEKRLRHRRNWIFIAAPKMMISAWSARITGRPTRRRT